MLDRQISFLSHILPEQGTYFALALGKENERYQRAFGDIQSLVEFCNFASQRGLNAYMALSSYADPEQGRRAVNASQVRCLWADLDVGKKDGYPTIEAAAAALSSFTNATGLYPTYIVKSGIGLHVYWAFSRSLPRQQWIELSRYFAALQRQYGVQYDTHCDGDASRVLRLPFTTHQSSGATVEILLDNTAKRIYEPRDILQVIIDKLDTTKVAVAPAPVQHVGSNQESMRVMQKLGFVPEPTADAEKIANNCPALLTMGMQSYQQWFLGMTVLRRCTNGREWAHKLSGLDPRYNARDTDYKFDNAGIDNPARCDSFRAVCPDMCARCAYNNTVTSPVELSRVAVVAKKSEPPVVSSHEAAQACIGVAQCSRLVLPEHWEFKRIPIAHGNYVVDKRGIVKREVTKNPATGEFEQHDIVLCASQLYYLYSETRIVDDRPQRSHMFEIEHPGGNIEHARFIIDEDLGPQQTARWFNNANMYSLNGVGGSVLANFMNAYLATVVHGAPDLPTVDKFGWHQYTTERGEKEMGFVAAGGLITHDGMRPVRFGAMAAPHAEKEFTHAGSLEKWKFIPQMYKTLGQEIGQLTICMAFAAPLMKYGAGEAKNAILSIWSPQSGQGKSQLLAACASIWGNPQHAFFSRQESVVARMRRLALWSNIPALMDELTDVKDEDMYNLAYTLAGGKEKNKLKSSGDAFVQTGDWSTCTISTANRSFKEAVAKFAGDSEATLLRVMEYECTFPSYENNPQVQEYINACMAFCKQHYGLAGPEFIYQLLQNSDRLLTLTRMAEKWCDKHRLQSRERFMGYPLALALTAGRWAVEWGLLDYDMDALEEWVIKEFIPHNRKFTSEYAPDVRELLAGYIAEASANTLIVRSEDRPADMKEPATNAMPDAYIISRPPNGEVHMRYAFDDHELRISARDLKRWCRYNRISMMSFVKRLDAAGIKLQRGKVALTKHIRSIAGVVQDGFILDSDTLQTIGVGYDAFADTDAIRQGDIENEKVRTGSQTGASSGQCAGGVGPHYQEVAPASQGGVGYRKAASAW